MPTSWAAQTLRAQALYTELLAVFRGEFGSSLPGDAAIDDEPGADAIGDEPAAGAA